jgi:hypothetical protein
MIHYQKTQSFKFTPIARIYKQRSMVNKNEVEFVEVYIFIYNGLNEGSFYQVGSCLQVGSCMRIGFLTSQLDMRSTSWDLL